MPAFFDGSSRESTAKMLAAASVPGAM